MIKENEMNPNQLAGQILRNLRHEYGLSQRALAENVTLSGTSLCDRHYRRIEYGQMQPSVRLAMAICSALDSDVYEVWT